MIVVCSGREGREEGWPHPVTVFRELDENDRLTGDMRAWRVGKFTRAYRIGCVYELAQAEDGKVAITTQPTILRAWGDEGQIAAWKLRTRAIEAQEAQERQAISLTSDLPGLDDLRREWRKCRSPQARRAFELALLEELRK